MKNYKALTKLRKQQFERAEQDLAIANARLNRLREEKERLRADMRAVEPPKEGSGLQMGAVVAQKRTIQQALDALQYRIDAAEADKREKEKLLKDAHIAWEQAKSIESQILSVLMAKQKRETQNRLDEIASQQFWRERNGERKGGI
ncbi:flagellar FliJ family protein [Hydrogenimonas sp.]|uniref:flagellar FliJ family protein n=1 Tax=Hydrogenimonas sp. TaxID=2231112 RepID=UPI002637841E|nr:flagellar FliJ family protein [Hydrogenimonas sp.]